jgi:hypothetical protein
MQSKFWAVTENSVAVLVTGTGIGSATAVGCGTLVGSAIGSGPPIPDEGASAVNSFRSSWRAVPVDKRFNCSSSVKLIPSYEMEHASKMNEIIRTRGIASFFCISSPILSKN